MRAVRVFAVFFWSAAVAVAASGPAALRWEVPGGAVRYAAPASWGALSPLPAPEPRYAGARVVAAARFADHDPAVSLELWTWDAVLPADPEPDPRDIGALVTHMTVEEKTAAVQAFEALYRGRSLSPLVYPPPNGTLQPVGLFWPGPGYALAVHWTAPLASADGRLRGALALGTACQELDFNPAVTLWLGDPGARRVLVVETETGLNLPGVSAEGSVVSETDRARYAAAEADLAQRTATPPLGPWLAELRAFAGSVAFE